MNEGRFTFADRTGDNWDVTLTLLGARRVDNSDFAAIYDGEVSLLKPPKEFFTAALTNTPLVIAMIWAVVQPQAQKKGLTEDQFVDRFDGKAVKAAKEAFWEALVDFFQDPGNGLSRLVAVLRESEKKIAQRFDAETEKLNMAVDTFLGNELDVMFSALNKSLGTTSSALSPPAV